MNYVFGPVPSRRLGRSLGIDLVPFKTCSYDCIYCQLGRTTHKTVERRQWAQLDDVIAELTEKLDSHPDYITLSGSGEPTLCTGLDELIARIHALTAVPVAVLTNGSLLWDEGVRRELLAADVVIPSLDAGDRATFLAVNRPHRSLDFARMLEGLIAFRDEYAGQYWLEVFLLGGSSAVPAEVAKIAAHAKRIRPDKVQINTVTRPPAEGYALGVDRQRLTELATLFDPPAEIIADFRGVHAATEFAITRERVLEMISRRPCTLDDMVAGLAAHRNEIVKYLEELNAEGVLVETRTGGKLYFARRHA
jgi:wyosine [tRNA(Phe)-imidazoG37] synthetase (radical SAM superfamily)